MSSQAHRVAVGAVHPPRLLHRPPRRREGRQGRADQRPPDPQPVPQGVRTLYLTAEDPPAEVCVPRLHAAGLTAKQLRLVDFVDCVKRTREWRRQRDRDRGAVPVPRRRARASVARGGRRLRIRVLRSDRRVHVRRSQRPQRAGRARRPRTARRDGPGDRLRRDRPAPHQQGPGQADDPRRSGSVAWRNAARSSFLVGRNPADPDQRVVAPNGFNYSAEGNGVSFRIRGTTVTIKGQDFDEVAQIYEVESCSLSADDLLVKAREGWWSAQGDRATQSGLRPGRPGGRVPQDPPSVLGGAHRQESLDSAAALLGVKQKIGRHWYWALTQEALDAWWPKASAASEDT